MNRLTRYLLYVSVSLGIALSVLGVQHLMMMPAVYGSIHQMGDRVGRVLPHGYTDKFEYVEQNPNGAVTLTQPSQTPRVIRVVGERTSQTIPHRAQAPRAGIDLRVPILLVVVYLAVLFFVSTISLWNHRFSGLGQVPAGEFINTLVIGSIVCILIAALFSASRVFWTGVDQSMAHRSLVQVAGSPTIRIQADQRLAMTRSELLMLMVAMVLTAVPILYWIDTAMLGGNGRAGASTRRRLLGFPLLSRLSESRVIERHFSEETLKRLCAFCYVLVVLFLWGSPWSTTIVHAFMFS